MGELFSVRLENFLRTLKPLPPDQAPGWAGLKPTESGRPNPDPKPAAAPNGNNIALGQPGEPRTSRAARNDKKKAKKKDADTRSGERKKHP